MATHSSILAWKIPWTEEPGELQSVKVKPLSPVRLFETPWTVPARILHPWYFPGKITGVGCHFLLQGIFPTQESNPGLPNCWQTLYCLSHKGATVHGVAKKSDMTEHTYTAAAAAAAAAAAKLLQSCPTLCDPMDCSLPGSSVHGIAKSRTRLSDFPFTFHFHALGKEMAPHSNVLAWRIPGTGEPGGLPLMGSHRVGHD